MLTLKDYKKKAWNELENIKIIQNNGGGKLCRHIFQFK